MFKKNYYILFLCSLLFSINSASGTSCDELTAESYENTTIEQNPAHCEDSTSRELTRIFYNQFEQLFNDSKSAIIPYNANRSTPELKDLKQQLLFLINKDQENLDTTDIEENITASDDDDFLLSIFQDSCINSEDLAANHGILEFDDLSNTQCLTDPQVSKTSQSTAPLPLKIQISKNQDTDSEELAEVHILAWLQSYPEILNKNKLYDATNSINYKTNRTKEHLNFISKSTSDSNYTSLAVKINNKIVGFCNFGPARNGDYSFDSDTSKGEIYTLYLLDEVKGKGVGSKLFKKVDKILKKKELFPYKVWTLEDNKIARAFYKAKGGVLQKKTDASAITKDIEIFEDHYKEVCYVFNQ